ncbi:MAG: carbon monoxide dehydrogenase subunit G [Herbaspirillum sp.]
MELNGERVIEAPRQIVWDALNDPAILSRCIPGCEELTKISDSETHARVLLKVGPVRARFSGKIFMTDLDVPSKCTLKFEGMGGVAGFAKGKSDVTLSDEGTGTKLCYSTQAAVGGRLGQVGGRLIDSSAKKMADEFFAALDDALATPNVIPNSVDIGVKEQQSPSVMANLVPEPALKSLASNERCSTRDALKPELYRAFWFIFGVIFGFAVNRWLS